MLRSTDASDCVGDHDGPAHVPRIDRQTLPLAYKFGLKPTVPRPVVASSTLGQSHGYAGGNRTLKWKKPPA